MQRLVYGTRSYTWFEKLAVACLTLLVAISVLLALAQSAVALYQVMASDTHLLDHEGFIKVFGTFMTLLIALEFIHTVLPDITSRAPVVKVKAVLLVTLLALARKVVPVDFKEFDYTASIGLAVLIGAVTLAYWAVQREERLPPGK